MTPSDLISTLLIAGFYAVEPLRDPEDKRILRVSIKEKIVKFSVDQSCIPAWRYVNTHPYDMGAIVLTNGHVLVVYELEVPNEKTWEHHCIFNSPAEAWDFIRNFLQEHPQ